jgi:DNA polymerase III alpha subunit (gram-positive type)
MKGDYGMREAVFDTETNGLAYVCDKIHILSYTYDGKEITSVGTYEGMRDFFRQEGVLFVAHNSVPFDMVVVNGILGLDLSYKLFVDTLAVSWDLSPERKIHGLGSYQVESGVEKPKVDDWEDVTWEQMKHRCESDVRINWWLWQKQRNRLKEIYGG